MKSFEFNVAFMKVAFVEALKGLPVAFFVTFASLAIAIPIGFLCAMARHKRVPVLQSVVSVVVSFLRGTPLVVQVFIVYAGFPRVFKQLVDMAGINYDVYGTSPYVYALLVFSLNVAATLTEVFRSALASVGKDQTEASLSVGLNAWQMYTLIIIPQALVSAIPNICNEVLNLFKSTSLVYMMAIPDVTGRARTAAADGYNYIEAYCVIFIIYVVVCYIMEFIFKRYESTLKSYKSPTA